MPCAQDSVRRNEISMRFEGLLGGAVRVSRINHYFRIRKVIVKEFLNNSGDFFLRSAGGLYNTVDEEWLLHKCNFNNDDLSFGPCFIEPVFNNKFL